MCDHRRNPGSDLEWNQSPIRVCRDRGAELVRDECDPELVDDGRGRQRPGSVDVREQVGDRQAAAACDILEDRSDCRVQAFPYRFAMFGRNGWMKERYHVR